MRGGFPLLVTSSNANANMLLFFSFVWGQCIVHTYKGTWYCSISSFNMYYGVPFDLYNVLSILCVVRIFSWISRSKCLSGWVDEIFDWGEHKRDMKRLQIHGTQAYSIVIWKCISWMDTDQTNYNSSSQVHFNCIYLILYWAVFFAQSKTSYYKQNSKDC